MAAGVSLDRVAQLLGHESVGTARIHAAPSEQDLQRKVEKVALVYALRALPRGSLPILSPAG